MIKDRNTGELRDFAFVEFFSLEDANTVMQRAKQDSLMVLGHQVHVTYSKIKRGEMPLVQSRRTCSLRLL